MGTTDDNEAPIVFSFSLTSLFHLLQFLFLVVCGYALLRCMHVLQRRSKKTKPIADKSLLSSDPSKSTTEESCVTTTEFSHDYVRRRPTKGNYDRFNLQGRHQRTQPSSAEVAKRVTSRPHDSFHRGYSNSPRFNYRVKRQGIPGAGRTVGGEGGGGGHGVERRHDYVTEAAVTAAANQSFVESESQHAIVESRPGEGNLSDYEGSSYQTIDTNEQSFVDYNYMDDEGVGRGGRSVRGTGRKEEREKESGHPSPQSFDSVNKPVSKSDDTRAKSDEATERPSRIKFSNRSAGVSCHRRFLAGTQEDGAYHPFPSSSDRLDCATQFVSREPSNVINLSPSAPKTYLDVDSSGGAGSGRGLDIPYSPMSAFPDLKQAPKYVHSVDSDTKAESPPVRKKKVKRAQKPSPRSNKQGKTRDSKQASGSGGRSTSKRSTTTRQQSPKTAPAKSHKGSNQARGEGTKNRMASNSYWGAPDLNTNYAATVSLQECGRELNRLILDTMRDYEDWGVAQPPPCRADLSSSSSPPSWSSPSSSLSIRERPNSSPDVMMNRLPAYQIQEWSNANDNKVLTEPSFRYSVQPVLRRRSKNRTRGSKPVVLADLLKELEILTKRINHHYDHVEMAQNKERGGEGKILAHSYNCSAAVWDRDEDDNGNLKSCEDIVLSNRFTATLSEASETGFGNGKTHSVFSSRITSMRQLSPQEPKSRPPVVTTTVSQRKKVFEETCPVTLHDTEIVCYMELVPKFNHPTGGLQVFKLDTVPSYQERDSSARETLEHGSDRTFLKDDVPDNFSENRISDSKEQWPKFGPKHLYKASVGGAMEITCRDPDLDQDTYVAGKSFNDATITHSCAVGNHGDNNKPRAQKDGYKTTLTLSPSPKKPLESTSNAKKTLPAKRGSYVANFRKTLRRKQCAQASSPVTRWKGFTSTKRCVPQTPTQNANGSPPFKTVKSSGVGTRPILKSSRGVQINTPTSSPNKDSYQRHTTQNEHPAAYKEGRFQNRPDTSCSPNKTSNYFHRGNPDKSKTPQDHPTNVFGCKTPNRKAQVKNLSDKRLTPNPLTNTEKRGLGGGSTNKMSAKQSTIFSSPTYNHKVLIGSGITPPPTSPHGPTESVRFEMKSTLASRVGHIRGRQKQKREYFPTRHNASNNLRNSLNQQAHFTFDNETNPSPRPNDKRFDRDSGIERNAMTVNVNGDMTKTVSSPSAFQRKGKHNRLSAVHGTSPYYVQRKWTPAKVFKHTRNPEDNASPMDTRCSVTHGHSPSTEPSSNALQNRSRRTKKNAFGNYRQSRRPISLTQRKNRRKEDGGNRRTRYLSPAIDHATYNKSSKPRLLDKRRWTKYAKSEDYDVITASPVSGCDYPGGGDTTLSDPSETKDFKYHTQTLDPRSWSSPDLAAATRVLQKASAGRRREVKRLRRGSLSETNPSGPRQVGPRKIFVKSPVSNEASDSGDSTFVVRKARSRSRRLRSDRSPELNVAERRYEIRMKDKSLGVARFLGYCMPSTHGSGQEDVEEEQGEEQEEEVSSSSTCFLLDTLDEISESLSDDEMVYW